MNIKVMTYNIHSGINNEETPFRSYDAITEVIKSVNADIVGLQEVGKHPTAGFLEYVVDGEPTEYMANKLKLNSSFAQAEFFYGRFPYGNALLTKYPIKSSRTVLIPDPECKVDDGYFQTRSILVAELDIGDGITVIVTHFGVVKEEKINAVKCTIDLIKSINTPVLLLGDLNMIPDDEILKPLFEQLNDVAKGKNQPATWPSNNSKNVGDYEAKIKNIILQTQATRKIDYIFYSNEFNPKKEFVVETKASDHMPYVVEFEF